MRHFGRPLWCRTLGVQRHDLLNVIVLKCKGNLQDVYFIDTVVINYALPVEQAIERVFDKERNSQVTDPCMRCLCEIMYVLHQ